MLKTFIISILVQAIAIPPRTALENPAALTPVPKKIQKDYDKLWQRFATGKEDDKVLKDADKLQKKNPGLVPLMSLEAYIDLMAKRTSSSDSRFEQITALAPDNSIALSYLPESAFARDEY